MNVIRKPHLRSEEGSTLPLIAIFTALALAMVLVAASASSLYLSRARLFSLADGAALSGAESYELEGVAVLDGEVRATLDSGSIVAAVQEYLDLAPSADGFDELSVIRAETSDGRSAIVTLAATWHPPVLSPLMPDGVLIEVTSTARSVFQ
ncbi:pilus assembly protein TadG-related protein [Naasia lichenicola]|uniref:Putative Flp pilus-assembly TadG-like N-terminal domain-containing protein n=1 Tax=Naasia lichenicola TaxID=2565933 RepID=A0A4S4FHM0_9MICO|nr:pilus assembly protein TadG-related protein [Naasia lichenicola]THG28536.1 hypothetical protein E6C64_17125 [Naasia lichenicola]